MQIRKISDFSRSDIQIFDNGPEYFIIITLNDDVHNELVLLSKIGKKLKIFFLYGCDRNDALNSMQLT